MKKTLNMSLSKESLKAIEKQLNSFIINYNEGINSSVKEATETLYNTVIEYCYANNIWNNANNVYMEYDSIKNVGKVWTDNDVLIFNEMGTGIVGKNSANPHPVLDGWVYCENPKRNYEKGWRYLKDDGTYGWTKGLPSKHMFYDAFELVKDQIGDIVEVTLTKQMSGRYEAQK